MNIAKGVVIGVVGIVIGSGLTVGANAVGQWYTALRQDIRLAASKNAQPIPVASGSATLVSTPAPVSFESLPPCDQLDSIAKSGKSVSEFLVASARVNDLAKYQTAIASICPWNAEQLQVADRVLNPPVIVVSAPVVTVSSGSSGSGSSGGSWEPAPWNNCNGIQEPGESYSARCHAEQWEDWMKSNGRVQPDPEPQPDPIPDPRPDPGVKPAPPTHVVPMPKSPPSFGYNAPVDE